MAGKPLSSSRTSSTVGSGADSQQRNADSVGKRRRYRAPRTPSEFRERAPKETADLTDDELAELIVMLERLATVALDEFSRTRRQR